MNVCKCIEDNDDEQLTMSDLVSKIEEYCNDKIAFANRSSELFLEESNDDI